MAERNASRKAVFFCYHGRAGKKYPFRGSRKHSLAENVGWCGTRSVERAIFGLPDNVDHLLHLLAPVRATSSGPAGPAPLSSPRVPSTPLLKIGYFRSLMPSSSPARRQRTPSKSTPQIQHHPGPTGLNLCLEFIERLRTTCCAA